MPTLETLSDISETAVSIIEPIYYLAIILLTALIYFTYDRIKSSTQQQTKILENQEELMAVEIQPDLRIKFEGVKSGPGNDPAFTVENMPNGGIAKNFRLRGDIITPEDENKVPLPKRTEPYIIEPCEFEMKDIDADPEVISNPICHPNGKLRLTAYPHFYITGPGYRASPEPFHNVHEAMLNEDQSSGKLKVDIVYEDAIGNEYEEEVFTRGLSFDNPVDLETAYKQGTWILIGMTRSPPDRRSRGEKATDQVKELLGRK